MHTASLAEVGATNRPTTDTIEATFSALQRAQLARRGSFTLEARVAQLDQLRDAVKRHESKIIAACAADFRKPVPEVKLTEILPVLQEIRHTKKHLRKWMRPKRVAASIGVWGTRSYVRPEPKGVCLIIAPWNYPLNLALGP
ncbi:MAG: aldehyde dehydrogenase family protein, partial [Methylococcales bacterium]|nr:aldehyde dehydrogenase family protein [Methylococcales bacterium]